MVLFWIHKFTRKASTRLSTHVEQVEKFIPHFNWRRTALTLLSLGFPTLAYAVMAHPANELVSAVLLTLIALVFWSSHLMPVGWASGLVLTIALALRLLPLDTVWLSASSSPVIIILAGFVLAEAVRQTGLATFVAEKVAKGSQSSREVALKVAFYELIGAFVIPNVAVRVTLVIPILRALSLSPRTKRLMIIDAGITSIMTGSLTLMSSSSAVSSNAIVQSLFGVSWNFFEWLRIFGPVVIALWGIAQALIIWQIPSEVNSTREALAPPALTSLQGRTILILALMLTGWMLGPLIGISLAYVSVAGAVLLVIPKFGVMTIRSAVGSLRLDLAVFYIVSLSLPVMLTDSGVAKFVTSSVSTLIKPHSLLLLYAGLALVIIATRLLFANSVTLTAIFLPIVASLESTWHLNGLVASVILIFAGSFGFLLPAQSPAGVIAAEFGKIASKEFLRIGIPIAVCGMGIVIIAALAYWPLVV